MPRYFKTKQIQLANEALASFLLIENKLAGEICHGMLSDKQVRIYERAQARLNRRYLACKW